MKTATMKNSGFTLIELLVVISIIAILATIGITVFSGAQGSARDGKSRSEINSIAKSIEAAKDYVTNVYKYDDATFDDDFPKGLIINKYVYCVKSDATTTPPSDISISPVDTWTSSACTTGSGYSAITANTFPSFGSSVKSWTLCAHLERSSAPYCLTSLTRAPTPTLTPAPIP